MMPARRGACVVFVVGLILSGQALGQPKLSRFFEQAPLGLTWGMSTAETRALGVELSIQEDGAFGVQAIARNVPLTLSDAEHIYLFFGWDDRLWRIVIASAEWENDDYGLQAVARFNELAELIDQKYGAGRPFISQPHDEFYAARDRFAYSLSENKRMHARTWETETLKLELVLRAQLNDTYYTIAYEQKDLAKRARQAQKDREKGAL